MKIDKKGISVNELNQAYYYINQEYRKNGFPTRTEVSIIIERKLENESTEELELKFKQEDIGIRGSYCFSSKDIFVIGVENP